MRVVSLVLVSLLAACAVDAGDGEPELPGDDLASEPDQPGDGKADAAFDTLSVELTAKYGLRPRRYNGFFNDSNEAERRFRAALPTLAAALNTRAKAVSSKISFTQAELATNFITEGGYYLLDLDMHDTAQGNQIDAFTYLGADTAVDNAAALRPWLSDRLNAILADPAHQLTATNELGQTVHTVYVDTIEQGMGLNAAMFAWSRQLVVASAGAAYSTWVDEAKFFWTTVWYNAGPGMGRKQLTAEGVNWWKKKWTSGDDPTFSRYIRYNVLWRTSTWEFMKRTLMLP